MTDTPRIVRSPGVISGSWRLEHTRMPVKLVYDLQVRHGYTTEEIVEDYPHLTPAQVEYAIEWFGRAYGGREPRRTADTDWPRPVAAVST